MSAMNSWTGFVSANSITRQLCCLLLATSLGCAGLQDGQYCIANKARAEISWLTCTDCKERWDLGSDYAHGYKKGFFDAATGRGCKLPAIPPSCYWSTKYQSCEGQAKIQCWYRGYQCGAVAAQGKGYPSFHDVPLGPCAPSLNNTGCQGCYSPDNCACNQSDQPLPVQFCADNNCHPLHNGMFGQYGSALVEARGAAAMQSEQSEIMDDKSASDNAAGNGRESVPAREAK